MIASDALSDFYLLIIIFIIVSAVSGLFFWRLRLFSRDLNFPSHLTFLSRLQNERVLQALSITVTPVRVTILLH